MRAASRCMHPHAAALRVQLLEHACCCDCPVEVVHRNGHESRRIGIGYSQLHLVQAEDFIETQTNLIRMASCAGSRSG